jgi:hypothetical protein
VFRHSCFFFETFITNEQLIWIRKTFSTNIQIKAKISPILGRLFHLIHFTVGHIKKILKSTLSQLKIVLFVTFQNLSNKYCHIHAFPLQENY